MAVIIWLICGFVSATVAANKGRSGCIWFGLGVLFGPFGLIVALVLPPDKHGMDRRAEASGSMKKCPYCAEFIRREARKCRYCGEDVSGVGVRPGR